MNFSYKLLHSICCDITHHGTSGKFHSTLERERMKKANVLIVSQIVLTLRTPEKGLRKPPGISPCHTFENGCTMYMNTMF